MNEVNTKVLSEDIRKDRLLVMRLFLAAVLSVGLLFLPLDAPFRLLLSLIPLFIAGYDTFIACIEALRTADLMDEAFLMTLVPAGILIVDLIFGGTFAAAPIVMIIYRLWKTACDRTAKKNAAPKQSLLMKRVAISAALVLVSVPTIFAMVLFNMLVWEDYLYRALCLTAISVIPVYYAKHKRAAFVARIVCLVYALFGFPGLSLLSVSMPYTNAHIFPGTGMVVTCLAAMLAQAVGLLSASRMKDAEEG